MDEPVAPGAPKEGAMKTEGNRVLIMIQKWPPSRKEKCLVRFLVKGDKTHELGIIVMMIAWQ